MKQGGGKKFWMSLVDSLPTEILGFFDENLVYVFLENFKVDYVIIRWKTTPKIKEMISNISGFPMHGKDLLEKHHYKYLLYKFHMRGENHVDIYVKNGHIEEIQWITLP